MTGEIRSFLNAAACFALTISGATAAEMSSNALRAEFEKIAHDAKGRVGAAVKILESDAIVDFHGEERFPMHSVYKLPISMAVLQRVDR